MDSEREPNLTRELAASLARISELTKRELSPTDFHQALLKIVVSATRAMEGTIWSVGPAERQPLVVYPGDDVNQHQDLQRARDELTSAIDRAPRSAGGDRIVRVADDDSPTRHRLVSWHRLRHGADRSIVLELIHPEQERWVEGPSFLPIMQAIEELTSDYHRNHELEWLRRENRTIRSVLRFGQRVRQITDLAQLLPAVAQETTRALNVDRTSILELRDGKFHLRAVSGVDHISQRSTVLRKLESAVNELAHQGLPHTCSRSDLEASETEADSPAAVYLRDSQARQMMLLPLSVPVGPDDSGPWGILLLEAFGDQDLAVADELLRPWVTEVEGSIRNALFSGAPPSSRGQRRHSAAGNFRRLGWSAVILLALLLPLFLIPVDFEIPATGQILPRRQQRIFSPADGEVVELHATQNQSVESGAELLRIHDSDLELRLSRLLGERLATMEKLQAIESRRISDPQRSADNRQQETAELSATAEELQILLNSQNEQIKILQSQQQQLTLLSPLSGEVVTWQVDKLLNGRPVQRGQLLMTLADVDGAWDAELEIRDYRVGHVIDAMSQSDSLPVTFILLSRPDQVHRGTLGKLNRSTGENLMGEPVVLAEVSVDQPERLVARPGAKISAKILCGKRSLAYVWFHEPVAAIRAALF